MRSDSASSLPMELSVIPLSLVPLAFASALIRYRLMDVEVIVKRSLVYTAVILAIFTIYATLLRLAGIVFLDDADQHNMIIAMLATIVVVLLFSPVKSAIQNALDRAFYRDKYDYRRALVGFARDLNSDLDLDRLGERLVARIRDTFVIDRMGLLLVDEASGNYEVIRAEGFGDLSVPGLSRHSQLAASLAAGRRCRSTIRGSTAHFRRKKSRSGGCAASITSFPACRKAARSRYLRSDNAVRASRSAARIWACCRPSAATWRLHWRTAGCIGSCNSRRASFNGFRSSTRTSSSRSTMGSWSRISTGVCFDGTARSPTFTVSHRPRRSATNSKRSLTARSSKRCALLNARHPMARPSIACLWLVARRKLASACA